MEHVDNVMSVACDRISWGYGDNWNTKRCVLCGGLKAVCKQESKVIIARLLSYAHS